jgi:uncharacterized protein with NRDE domain
MCLIAWNWSPGSATPLLLVANRDEFYARPAAPLHWWPDGTLLAGQDLEAGGTWLAVDRKGRLAALTNYRQGKPEAGNRPSRGALVTDFLRGALDAPGYLAALAPKADRYNPFNLLVYDGQHLMGLESRHQRIVDMQPGIAGVSNADFDTPWPKLLRLKSGLRQQCGMGRTDAQDLLPLLQDRATAADADLPHTGIPLDRERVLSAVWISSAHYGTRASSVVTLSTDKVIFFEQSYGAEGPLGAAQQIFTH